MPWMIHPPPLLSALCGLLVSRPACLPVRVHACHCVVVVAVIIVVVVRVGLDEDGNICPKGPQGLPVAKRVWAPGSEKEIPICCAGPAHQEAFKVTVVAASQARVVSKCLVRHGTVRRGMDPISQGVALSRIRGIS